MSGIIVSTFTNPHVNAAVATYFAHKAKETILFLSRSCKTVSVGVNQNTEAECNRVQMQKDNIYLIRRDTGGGACYLDEGCRLVSFIEPNCDKPHKRYMSVVVNAFNQLNLNGNVAVIQGRNDICIAGKKVSGSAFAIKNREGTSPVFRHHLTALINANMDNLSKYLTPSKIKLESKGVKSVAARVCNLTEFNPAITYVDFDRALISSFLADCGTSSDLVVLDKDNFNNIIDDPKLYNKILARYTSDEFIFNENPPFSLKLEHKFSFGIVQINLECEAHKIVKSAIYSDSLDLKLIECLREVFVGKYYNMDLPIKMFHNLNRTLGQDYTKVIQEFCEYFQKLFRDDINRFMSHETNGFMSIG